MKKVLIAILISVFLLGLVSCSVPKQQGSETAADNSLQDTVPDTSSPGIVPSANPAAFREDFDNRFGRGYQTIIETDEAYYFCAFCGPYVYYYDKAGDVFGVLCSKPECMHDAKEAGNNNCGGTVNSHAKSLFLSGGRLYFVSSAKTPDFFGPALYSMKPDGTGREMVMKLDFGETQDLCWPQRYDLHRGKLYGFIDYEKVEAGEPMLCLEIVSLDPASGDYRTICKKDNCWVIPQMFYLDDYVYFSVPDYDSETKTLEHEIFRWDIVSEELETVYSSGGPAAYSGIADMWVESDGSIFLISSINDESQTAELMLISNGELRVISEYSDSGIAHFIGGGTVNLNSSEKELIVTDLNGSELKRIGFELELPDDPNYTVDASRSAVDIYGDTDELLVVYSNLKFSHSDGKMSSGSCLVLYDLTEETPTAQLLAISPWH